jgi:hypothetical protein
MDECAICGSLATFIMIEGGWYLCLNCIDSGEWRSL